MSCEESLVWEDEQAKKLVHPEFRDKGREPVDRMRTVQRVADNVFVRKPA